MQPYSCINTLYFCFPFRSSHDTLLSADFESIFYKRSELLWLKEKQEQTKLWYWALTVWTLVIPDTW